MHSALMPIRRQGDLPPLFSVHGQPLLLAQMLPDNRPVYALNYVYIPNEKNQRLESIESVARIYIDAMVSVQPSGPYYLCGFSAGAMIAYEMAVQLQRQRQEVAHICLIEPTMYALTPSWWIDSSGALAKSISWPSASRYFTAALWKRISRQPKSMWRRLRTVWYSVASQPFPADLRWTLFIIRLIPFTKRYRYQALPVRADFVFRASNAIAHKIIADYWRSMTNDTTRVHFVDSADTHLDLVQGATLKEIVRIIDGALEDTRE